MQTSDFKKGVAVKYNGETYVIVGYQFVNPGKGAAFTRAKMKNAKTGRNVEVTFKSGENVEEANMENKRCQYLYNDSSEWTFMDNQSYDQFSISKDMIGDDADFLIDGTEVVVVFVDDSPASIELPTKMDFKVISAPPGEKGDTATGGTKPVVIETGATISAPLFIKEGDVIRVNTELHEYVERAK
ncbi:MAG: elongation factor P [Candidatus Gracilibacteria bacterium]